MAAVDKKTTLPRKEEADNKMKKYLLNIAAIFLLTFSITGCYTVIWDPSQPQLPDNQNSDINTGFYSDPYFGGYAYYYDSPWWFDLSLPTTNGNDVNRDGNINISSLRNIGNGRGSVTRTIWNLFTDPASRSSQSGSVNKGSTGNTGTTTSTQSDNRSSDSKSLRNNNGSRKTDKDRGRSR